MKGIETGYWVLLGLVGPDEEGVRIDEDLRDIRRGALKEGR